jgi:hypothetical protein
MMKLLLLLIGFAGGAGGTASWLLSLPEKASEPAVPTSPDSARARIELVRTRLSEALAEGQRAGAETEQRLQQELDSYRRGAVS